MASFTVRNVPEDAKQRFRQVAAAHGRSMEEHLRQLVVDAGFSGGGGVNHVADAPQIFRHSAPAGETVVRELLRVANGGGGAPDTGEFAAIRFMSAKNAMAELRRLANGAGFDQPPRLSTELEAPGF